MDPKESKSNTMAHFGGADKDVVVIDQEVPGYQLGKCGRWLSSIPPEHERAMRQTREYREFLAAFERLEHAHGKVNEIGSSFSFIQYMAADDIILRIFEFLESQSLVACQRTCSRLLEMANKSANRRVRDVGSERQLSNVMMLLRAKEQLEGVAISATGTHVRIPTLLLSRRVQVTNAGDPELNGIYHCTGSNGNGFVFTKPRQPVQRVERRSMRSSHEEAVLDLSRDESEVAQPGKMLRCLIAKRFSNETILWYLSKEVVATEGNGDVQIGDVTQLFSFWSKLMVIGDASPDICRYPSQSSILATHSAGWRALSSTRTMNPPTVELLDS